MANDVKLKFVTDASGNKFYPITIANGVAYIKKDNTQVLLSDFLDNIDYTGKADKVSGATPGNFASLDANGNLVDSGKKASDFQAAGDYKTTQAAVADPTASGNAVSFIDSITQNPNGVISPTKKTIPNAAASTNGVGGTAGLMSAADKEKLDDIDYSGKADKVTVGTGEGQATAGNFFSIDANGNLADSGAKAADFATAAQGAKADTAVQSVAEGATNGTIAVDGTDVAVHGLGTAAYANTGAFDASGAAAAVLGTDQDAASANTVYGAKAYADAKKNELLGDAQTDTASSNTIAGAKKYADSVALAGKAYQGTVAAQTDLPSNLTSNDSGKYYIVTGTGKFAYWNGSTWDMVDQETAVSAVADPALTIGTAVKVAEVEGVEIKVKQVEDTTKLEAVACNDTSDYADVSSLFTAPSAGE